MDDDTRIDLRRARAEQLAHAVLDTLRPFLAEEQERDVMREAHYALFDLLYNSGAEVINDQQRAEIGLPTRDVKGWTADELRAWEARRLELMLRPAPTLLMGHP